MRAKSVASKRRLANPSAASPGADGVDDTRVRRPRKASNHSEAVTGAGSAVAPDSVAKVVRDSFTMPVVDYLQIGALKQRCIGLGFAVKKSELLRAGLHVLGRISNENLAQVVAAVESVKTGRPPGKKKRKKSNQGKDKKQ